MKRLDWLIVTLILVLAVLLRLYRIDIPLADWHSYRQTDTASVARNFYHHGINLLYPQSDNLLPLSERQIPNPNRYFMNEFPIYTAMVAAVYQIFGLSETHARLTTVVISITTIIALYLLTRSLFGRSQATLASLFYAILPFSIFYGRVVLPDQLFVSLSVWSAYVFWRYLTYSRKIDLVIFTTLFATAILAKPYAVFLVILFGLSSIDKYRLGFKSYLPIASSLLLAILPFLAWRYHVSFYPEGSFATDWLFNGDNIRFTGAYFHWLLLKRVIILILGGTGFVLLMAGLIKIFSSRSERFVLYYLFAIITYLVVFATGNVTHDYYQLPLIPVISILLALGVKQILALAETPITKLLHLAVIIILIGFGLAFSWYDVRGYYQINNGALLVAGERVRDLTPPGSLIIAPYQTDPTFLYYTYRYGWTLGNYIEDKIAHGAGYYVSLSYDDEARELADKYETLEHTDNHIIIKLAD
jgi:4-amino-4-deoxy-L-arabinose transferase-like glycosyltransferase